MPNRLAAVLGATALAGAAGLAYSVAETGRFVLRRVALPILGDGIPTLRVLHLSDLHMTPGQRRKQEWVRSLAALEPDLVINTGDNLAHLDALPAVLDAFDGLLDRPGAFVLGSNDYFSPTFRNPARYLLPNDWRRNVYTAKLPWRELSAALADRGWLDLDNTCGSIQVGGARIALAGVDDPHLGYDDLRSVAGPADPTADIRLGVTHAPYLRVLDQFAADGYDAIFAGHTHGGQLCLPVNRALVTNCDLEPARASGLHRHPASSPPGAPGSTWLHVSAGLGTSPYAPVRFCCRPEATLLELVPDRP